MLCCAALPRRQARQRHMTLELKERHKLNVYKVRQEVMSCLPCT